MPDVDPTHRCRVLTSPSSGVYATVIESGRHFPRHWHTAYGLGLMDDGAHRSSSDRRSFDAFAGDILCTNPGELHDGQPLAGPLRRWRTAYIDPAIVRGLHEETGGSGDVAFTQASFSDERLRLAVDSFLAQLAAWTDGAGDALAFDESLATALGLMLRHHSTCLTRTDAQAADLAPVLQRLGDDIARAPSLAELAALAGLGRFQLLRRFRRVFGTTPHGWLMQHRAERARTLIRRGSSIADAAAQCGFADQSHLTRVFTQRFGFTPGAWKKAQ